MKWSVFFIVTLIILLPLPLISSYTQISDDCRVNQTQLTNYVLASNGYINVNVSEAKQMIESNPDLVILDVRTQSEYDNGHIYSVAWIPHTELEARIGELTGHENHEIIVYCRSGVRSVDASEILDSHNFTKVYNMLGGILEWQSAGYPVWIATVHNINTTSNYDTIQAAIGAPQTLDGHTIFVDAGTYYENVGVNKSLSLIGENSSTTIIDGSFIGHVVEVTANNTKISGFTIRKSGCGCQAKSGVSVGSCQNVNVTNNLIIQNGYGIRIYQAYNITVASNNITNNAYDGVYIYWSFSNTIFRNNIINNDLGILSSSSNNVIFHNNFVDNTEQIYSYNSTNIWDDDYPSGGNYWSDHNPPDADLDKIGDDPYIIDENNTDRCPLIYPYGFVPKPDANDDGIINIKDLFPVAQAFGTIPGEPNWNPIADVELDEAIGIEDLYKIAKDYGKTV
jgi:phage shock protein E